MLRKNRFNGNDADDSDSDSNDEFNQHYKIKPPIKRSSTASPGCKNRQKYYYRRRSDVPSVSNSYSYLTGKKNYRRKSSIERSNKSLNKSKSNLRKTNSEPNVEQVQNNQINLIKNLLDTLSIPIIRHQSTSAHDIWMTPRQSLVPDDYMSVTEDEYINTEIKELREAAESIQSLQRSLKLPISRTSDISLENSETFDDGVLGDSSKKFYKDNSLNLPTSTTSITTTHFGLHPRGVMQFLPSVKPNSLSPRMDTYRFNRNGAKFSIDSSSTDTSSNNGTNSRSNSNNMLTPDSRTQSIISDGFIKFENDSISYNYTPKDLTENNSSISLPSFKNNEEFYYNSSNIKIYRTNEEGEMFQSTHTECGELYDSDKGANSIASVSRFSDLLKSFKNKDLLKDETLDDEINEDWDKSSTKFSNTSSYDISSLLPPLNKISMYGSQTLHPNLLQLPTINNSHSTPKLDQTLLQADKILWKKRSRASLRRHQDVRILAIRELFETEKSYVESLDYIVQKFMRPLKQPMEGAVIDSETIDKIFYKIPEILAHHQVLLAALYSRIKCVANGDYIIADVLMAHFKKVSMIETYIAFVNNFKAAKQAIHDARQKPSFDKFYRNFCKKNHSKLDLDSILILPIQKIPRYELLLKQIIKHTSVEHFEYEKLMLVKHYVHELAVKINKQRDDNDYETQNLLRYDLVALSTQNNDIKKGRCIFMTSDQMIIASFKNKANNNCFIPNYGKNIKSLFSIQHSNFLNENRFKLLMKISLNDVDICKDTLTLLNEVKKELKIVQEDSSILNKMMDLSKLLECPSKKELSLLIEECYLEKLKEKKNLEERMQFDSDLTSVDLQILTFDGIEKLNIQFGNADKRATWEKNLVESKKALINDSNINFEPPEFVTYLPLKLRNGLDLSVATPTFEKSIEGASNLWIASTDKFSGQISTININGVPTVESSTFIGNSTIVSIISVPAPKIRNNKKNRVRDLSNNFENSVENAKKTSELLIDSSSSESELYDSESTSISILAQHSTIWIGNEDGEIFVFNYHDNIKNKYKEKTIKLQIPIIAMVYVEDNIFVSCSSKYQNQFIYFERKKDTTWDLQKRNILKDICNSKIDCMIAVAKRLCFSSENYIYLLLNGNVKKIEKKTRIGCNSDETISYMSIQGSNLFLGMTKSPNVKLLNAFTFELITEFSISPIINKTLSVVENIIRQHKMGCLKITSMTCAKGQLFIGTSAGIILSTNVNFSKNNFIPNFNVCNIAHAGSCNFLICANISTFDLLKFPTKSRRMSLNASLLERIEEIYLVSGGKGIDMTYYNTNISGSQNDIISKLNTFSDGNRPSQLISNTENMDAINHLLFWKI
uniref:Rho guanine nucleotide exchange factor 17 (inferred by orthology to a human protein) n=1 Tax=Strongyloides venezuelensis TaxID=75913 RepID=A0A0K0F6Y7_STRVS